MAGAQLDNNVHDEPKVDDANNNNPEEVDQNLAILPGLNLALILCSLTPSDDEEIQNLEEKEINNSIRERKGKIKENIVRKSKRMQVNEFRAAEKEKAKKTNRGNAKIKKDCRHGTKM